MVGRPWLRPIAAAVLTLCGASVFAFGVMHLAPGDPARYMLQFRPGMREEQVAELRAWYGLDRPLPVQYARWLGRAVQGEFGRSLVTRREIGPDLARRLPWTLTLAVPSALLAWALAVALAVPAARGGAAGRIAGGIVTAAALLPPFLLAVLLVHVFAVRLTWIPVLPPFDLIPHDPALWRALLLPCASVALPVAAIVAGRMRADLHAALRAPHVTAALARGLPERRVVWRHALGTAAHPVLARPLPTLSLLVGALLVVEEIFNWPGLGRAFIRAIVQRDIPVVQAVLLALAVLTVLAECAMRLLWDRGTGGRASSLAAPDLRYRAALVLVAALILTAAAAPLIARFPPGRVALDEINMGPSWRHLMGTDSSGRDMLSRLLHAGRMSLGLALGAAVLAAAAGTGMGVLALRAGHREAGDQGAIARVVTAIPALALTLAVISVAGRSPAVIGAVLAACGLAAAAAGLRGAIGTAWRRTFVEAARAAGAGPIRIAERHLLPHLARPLLAAAAGLVPGFLVLEAALGFLGFSVTPTIPTWGTLLWRGREALHRGDWWLLVSPAGFLAAAAWGFDRVATAMADPPPRLRPRASGRSRAGPRRRSR